MNRDSFPPRIDQGSACGGIRRFPWLTFSAVAMTISAFAVIIYGSSGVAQNMLLNHALEAAAKDRAAGQAFAMAASSAKVLAGISGEAVPSSAPHGGPLADTEILRADGPLHHHVAPAGLSHLTADDCITLTTQTGQALSFRIVGVHAGKTKEQDSLPQLDLEITACTDTGNTISKARVEPISAPVEKGSGPQQNL